MRGALQNQKEWKKTLSDYEIIRNKAIFELLLSSGIRVRELVNLDKNDIDLNSRTFTVMGKGSKERECYCSVKSWVEAWEIYILS
jgi:site-specific recombinase XerD